MSGENITRLPCPTCTGPGRQTVGMVCPTCGTDYGAAADSAAGADLREQIAARVHERHAPFATLRQCEAIADDLLAGPLWPLVEQAVEAARLREAVERHILSGHDQFGNLRRALDGQAAR